MVTDGDTSARERDLSVADRPPRAGERGSHMVAANGLWHHVLEYGAGARPLVLLPGMTAAAATLGFIARALSARYRVFVPDARGRGLSDHPVSGFRLRDYAEDLAGY
jgi:pimeloyl-ACP methyl ester carboxylesterase